jgi:hypothetical protein
MQRQDQPIFDGARRKSRDIRGRAARVDRRDPAAPRLTDPADPTRASSCPLVRPRQQ